MSRAGAAVARDPGHQPNPAAISKAAAAAPALLILAGPSRRAYRTDAWT
jgi:hypothetical protein